MPGFIFLLIMILSAIKSVAQWTVKWAPSIVWTQGKWFLNGWPWVYFERRLWIFILVKKCCFLPQYLALPTSLTSVFSNHFNHLDNSKQISSNMHLSSTPNFSTSLHFQSWCRAVKRQIAELLENIQCKIVPNIVLIFKFRVSLGITM